MLHTHSNTHPLNFHLIAFLAHFRHNLPLINVMNKDASINDNGGAYTGLDRFVCRDKLWADMEAAGLTIKVDPHMQRVPRSQR